MATLRLEQEPESVATRSVIGAAAPDCHCRAVGQTARPRAEWGGSCKLRAVSKRPYMQICSSFYVETFLDFCRIVSLPPRPCRAEAAGQRPRSVDYEPASSDCCSTAGGFTSPACRTVSSGPETNNATPNASAAISATSAKKPIVPPCSCELTYRGSLSSKCRFWSIGLTPRYLGSLCLIIATTPYVSEPCKYKSQDNALVPGHIVAFLNVNCRNHGSIAAIKQSLIIIFSFPRFFCLIYAMK
jgi:hypothetical protein